MRNLILAGVSMIALTVAGGAMAAENPASMPPAMTAPSAAAQATTSEPSAEVKQAQEKLKSVHMYKGNIDGIAGPEMAKALKQFQEKNNLDQSSQLDEPTMQKLGINAESGSTTPPTDLPATPPTNPPAMQR